MYLNRATTVQGPAANRNAATLGANIWDRLYDIGSESVSNALKLATGGGGSTTTIVQAPTPTWVAPVVIGGLGLIAVVLFTGKKR